MDFDEILRGPLKISLIPIEIRTFCKGYPLQNVRKSIDFREILRGIPLRFD